MRTSTMVLVASAVLAAGALAAASTLGPLAAAAAVLGAVLLTALVALGTTRTAVLLLVAGFALAPMFRGVEGALGDFATPPDLLMGAGSLLLLPEVVGRKLTVPTAYVVGLAGVALTGVLAAALSGDLLFDLFLLVQWLFYLGALPLLVAWWRPEDRLVATMLWAYLGGHMVSTVAGLLGGPVSNGRYDGLTHHPNAFGLAGLVSIAIVLHLFARHRAPWVRGLLLLVAVMSVVSVTISGSRSATLVVAALIALVPVVERSAAMGFVFALLGALAVLALPLVVDVSGEGTALSRLAGGGTAEGADRSRANALSAGWERFLESPILGSGFVDVELYHNVFLEVAVAIGVIGLLFYLVVMAVLARPVVSTHEQRRLSYLVVAFIGTAPAFPGIWDRSLWIPMCLAILPVVSRPARTRVPAASAA